jgi:hypothetical protein
MKFITVFTAALFALTLAAPGPQNEGKTRSLTKTQRNPKLTTRPVSAFQKRSADTKLVAKRAAYLERRSDKDPKKDDKKDDKKKDTSWFDDSEAKLMGQGKKRDPKKGGN